MFSTINKIVLLSILVSVVIAIVIVYFAYTEIQRETERILEETESRTLALSGLIEDRLDKSIKIVEYTSTLPQVSAVPFADSISEEYLGIPENLDLEKRQIAKNLLASYEELEVVRFTMPNGYMYMLEPYKNQLERETLSMAHRDWFISAINVDGTDLSEVFKSQATKNKVVSITVPVKADDGSLLGLWSDNLDLTFFMNEVAKTAFSKDARVILVDHKGNEIFDSGKDISYNQEFRKASSESYMRASNGKTGTLSESFDGEKMFVAYRPLKAGPHDWVVLLVRPYDEVFSSVNWIITSSLTSLSLIVGILAVASYFTYRSFRSNVTLTKQLEKANKKLSSIDKEKDEFSAMITHELKTPLVPILGHTKMLSKKGMIGTLTDEQLESVKIIEKNAKRLEKLISDILDARKLGLGKMKFDKDDVSIDEFFSNLKSSFQSTLNDQDIEFIIKNDSKDVIVNTDEGRLRQVFDNLINNAIKFVPKPNGKITVSATLEDGLVKFYVKDNGIGIPQDKQQHIFKKFYQVDTSERREAHGSGLGLAICKGIIDNLGGKIWFESDEKTGTTFYFQLPANS